MDAATPSEESHPPSSAGGELVFSQLEVEWADWLRHRVLQGDEVILMDDGTWIVRDKPRA